MHGLKHSKNIIQMHFKPLVVIYQDNVETYFQFMYIHSKVYIFRFFQIFLQNLLYTSIFIITKFKYSISKKKISSLLKR